MMKGIARNVRGPMIGATALIMSACSGREDPPKARAPDSSLVAAIAASSAPGRSDTSDQLSPAARAALDSGNTLFRAKRYPEALAQYRLAATRAPDDGAAFFGVFMVASATKNQPLADSAMAALGARGLMAPTGPHTTRPASAR